MILNEGNVIETIANLYSIFKFSLRKKLSRKYQKENSREGKKTSLVDIKTPCLNLHL